MIICDFGPGDAPIRFDHARDLIVAYGADDLRPALARADAARAQGHWIAGWLAYEAGLALEPRLKGLLPKSADPLLVLGVYDAPVAATDSAIEEIEIDAVIPLILKEEYIRSFRRAQDYIAAGDCYQINLTFPLETRLRQGSARGLAAALARLQPVGHAAFADMGVGPVIVSRSPELFFATSADGRIEARPMKGTAPRSADPGLDAALAAELAASEKNRAENLMIVDLLRNDISVLAQIGSVKVPELFAVESYATVHQMTSRITARLAAPPSLSALMPALFPCGSITGAPKIRAMEIIHELEPYPRGIYCGTLGWMAPDGASRFSVAIRTLAIRGDNVRLNVGGGIVADSTAESEWEEALWKARFIQPLTTRS
ncbi:aminodeoxychorismate synthase component I [Paracoccus laeviglucosivorans]|uniref:Aminodeoxychorismate synthase, subunit I n=1 Tax=Paracoccus laeviglucosivorans TaxID=1197861 RepID=A0A521B151_9RHOB|nr:aminodeoxychorismate synthase component I [Paracoccus laeviglucosivorans]SMO40510.1 aminodeoxychorismate synthase, subunit I [Paracoccus laeviglucosivorans]